MQSTAKIIIDQLHKYIDKLDEYQARIVLSFIKSLFHVSD